MYPGSWWPPTESLGTRLQLGLSREVCTMLVYTGPLCKQMELRGQILRNEASEWLDLEHHDNISPFSLVPRPEEEEEGQG